MERALYLIGFSTTELETTPAIGWLAMAGVSYLDIDGIRCWIKELDRGEFEGEEAEKNLADINWLTPRVLAHDSAVSALNKQGRFFPARFGSLFSSKEPLRALVESARPAIQTFLDQVRDRREWGVKVYLNRVLADEAYATTSNTIEVPVADSGTNYLRARHQQRIREQAVKVWIGEQIEKLYEYLERVAERFVDRNIGSEPDAFTQREWVGNYAMLMKESEAIELAHELSSGGNGKIFSDRSNANGFLSFEMTGPWPAYSFIPNLQRVSCSAS
jgi:hypothetical protein